MGWYVETLVTFDAETEEEVSQAAGKYLASFTQEEIDNASIEAKLVLSNILQGRGYTCGQKGGVWAIAFTGNYTKGDILAKELLPFFQMLWAEELLLDFYHATIITQDEQNKSSKLFIIKHPGTVLELEGPAIWHEG